MFHRTLLVFAILALLACDTDNPSDASTAIDSGPPPDPVALFDLSGEVSTQETFFNFPYPSDLRLRADGTPDLTGYPNPRVRTVEDLLPLADRPGWPTMPVAYFRFAAPIASLSSGDSIAAESNAPILLVDVDPASPDRGRLYATIAETLLPDGYTGANLLAIASFPGLVLHADRTYAFVVRRALGDASGADLLVPEALASLAAGDTPSGAWGAPAAALYAPMFETLDMIGVARADVAAATVFTTGDVVRELAELSDGVLAREAVTIDGLALEPAGGGTHERYCELVATVSMPHFQRGTPPFDTEGRFELGADGLPIEQFREVSRVIINIPKSTMPAAGYPLMMYFHGSGGVADQVVDRGPAPPGGSPRIGEGPAHVIAEHGFASVGAALPLSPDRLPGASAIEYLNFDNLAAFPDTFRQGVIEQRLLMEALRSLEIDPTMLTGCDGPMLPAGETQFRFDPDQYTAVGQSMGGMYTNMIGAVEPSLVALAPTGAGGFWSFFILETSLITGIRGLLGGLLRVDGETLTHLHPAMSLLELVWERAEPMVFMPRLSRRPLPGYRARPVYEPVGRGDSFFPIALYDAVALAYGHPQVGEIVWPGMQESLAVEGLDGLISYPVANNLTNENGEPYTGAVVQDAGDGFSDPHVIFIQIADIRYQWGCFLKTAVETGTAVIPAPAPLGTPCPTM